MAHLENQLQRKLDLPGRICRADRAERAIRAYGIRNSEVRVI